MKTASSLRVAAVQLTSTDSPDDNATQILNALGALSDPNLIDLILFPENSLFFRIKRDGKMLAFDLSESYFQDIYKFCEHHQTEVILGSLPFQDVTGTSNAMVHFKPGQKPKVVYKKIHLFDVDVPGAPSVRESDSFRHGSAPQTIEIKGWKIGLSICYDLRFAELYLQYARQGVHVILVPSAFLVPTGKVHWEVLLRARAIESQAYVLAPAQSGEHKSKTGDSRHTWGHSLIIDPWGQIVEEGSDTKPILIADLQMDRLEQVRAQIPMHQHRRLT